MTSQGFRIYLGTNYHIWTRIITNLGSLRIGAVKEISELHLETLSSVNSMDSKPTAFDSIFPVFHHFLLRPLTASSSTASTVCPRRRCLSRRISVTSTKATSRWRCTTCGATADVPMCPLPRWSYAYIPKDLSMPTLATITCGNTLLWALSRSDYRNMPSSCNVCSMRMSPIPHPHTPGNMWAARCSYVSNLIDPKLFQGEMLNYFAEGKRCRVLQCNYSNVWCVGRGRFAAEHWTLDPLPSRSAALRLGQQQQVQIRHSCSVAFIAHGGGRGEWHLRLWRATRAQLHDWVSATRWAQSIVAPAAKTWHNASKNVNSCTNRNRPPPGGAGNFFK